MHGGPVILILHNNYNLFEIPCNIYMDKKGQNHYIVYLVSI